MIGYPWQGHTHTQTWVKLKDMTGSQLQGLDT